VNRRSGAGGRREAGRGVGRAAWALGACLAALGTHSGAAPADAVAAPLQPAPPSQAPAKAATAKAEIVVLHATNDKTGIDPKIGKMPELQKPPFSSYDSYKLLTREEVALARGQAKQHKLPDDGQLAVTLKEIVAPAKPTEPTRFSVSATIQKPGGKSFLPALDVSAKKGEIFFVAGQRYKGGILVIGIRVIG
jgi:hypothetical protein